MSDNIYSLIIRIFNLLGSDLIFVIFLCAQFISFCVVTALAIFKPFYTLRKRAWFFIASIALSFLHLAFLSAVNLTPLFYLSLFVTSALWLVAIVIPAKKLRVKDEERNLAKFIDEQVKAQIELPPVICQKQSDIKDGASENLVDVEEVSRFELDFQHVKNVMQKLEYYPLSSADKKTVKELEDNIYKAQTIGFSEQIKAQINDGLGALLKIMSKYGV